MLFFHGTLNNALRFAIAIMRTDISMFEQHIAVDKER